MSLPDQYKWLSEEPAPRMILEALKLYGTEEIVGEENNPTIMRWAYECGIYDYKADSIPWCGLFMAVVAKRAGKYIPNYPLWARNWATWGNPVFNNAELGDVLVFKRGSGGHVGLYVGEDDNTFYVLGGNQNDSVSITRIVKSRLLAIRNLYIIGKPRNVRRIFLDFNGKISTSEV